METPTDVLPESSPVEEGVVIPEEVTATPPAPQPKGTQTPPENLYAALAEERRLRKEAEDKLINYSPAPVTVDEVFSDEGRLLQDKISKLEQKLNSVEEEKKLEGVYSQYPVLKEQGSEFETFKSQYPNYKVEDVAKLFILEKGLGDTKPRKGLVKSSGGGQTAPVDGYTAEQVADLRKNNHRKYMDLLTSGKIRLDELK